MLAAKYATLFPPGEADIPSAPALTTAVVKHVNPEVLEHTSR